MNNNDFKRKLENLNESDLKRGISELFGRLSGAEGEKIKEKLNIKGMNQEELLKMLQSRASVSEIRNNQKLKEALSNPEILRKISDMLKR